MIPKERFCIFIFRERKLSKHKILFIDDEPLARQKIRRYLGQRKESYQIEDASNGSEALMLIPKFLPDLILLDISMPEMTGLELLYQLEDRPFKIVFQTAHDQFAIQAFEENACDYLMKPFTQERFNKALDKALGSNSNNVQLLEKKYLANKEYLRSVVVRRGAVCTIIPVQDIVCFISIDHCTHLYTNDREFICDLSISHLAERLPPNQFKQLHRNNIVRIEAIASVQKGERMKVQIKNRMSLPVSRANRQFVSSLLQLS